jgi:hypothetical protein
MTRARWCRENVELRLEKARATTSAVVTAKADDQVRRGPSTQALASLEYWIARLNRAMTWVGCLTIYLESIIAVVPDKPCALRCIIQNETAR